MSHIKQYTFKKEKNIRKILIFLLIGIFITTFSITAFAQETQDVHTETDNVKYVSSDEVNLVFSNFEKNFKPLPNSKTVTKSDLYKALSDTDMNLKIYMDLKINSEELISYDDLILYIDELHQGRITVVFVVMGTLLLLFTISIIIGLIIINSNICCMKPHNYSYQLQNIQETLDTISEKVSDIPKNVPTEKKRF